MEIRNRGTYREGTYKAKFDINKNDLNKKFYKGQEYKIELVEN